MPDENASLAHKQLAAELIRLRRMSGLTAAQLVAAIGQGKISRPTMFRIEGAESVPAMPVVRAWLDATKADDETRDRVLGLADAVHTETVRWKELLRGRGHLQDEVAERERHDARSRNFQPTVVPGLLQTADYTRRLAPITSSGQADPDRLVEARQRRQAVLLEPGRRFSFLVAEAALRGVPADLAAHQVERIAAAVKLETVEFAVLPASAWVATPWHNFVIHDPADGARYVTTELVHGAQRLGEETDVERYVTLWELLAGAAVRGAEAVELARMLA